MDVLSVKVVLVGKMLMVVVTMKHLLQFGVVVVKGDVFVMIVQHGLVFLMLFPSVFVVMIVLLELWSVGESLVSFTMNMDGWVVLFLDPAPSSMTSAMSTTMTVTTTALMTSAMSPAFLTVFNPTSINASFMTTSQSSESVTVSVPKVMSGSGGLVFKGGGSVGFGRVGSFGGSSGRIRNGGGGNGDIAAFRSHEDFRSVGYFFTTDDGH